MGNEEPVGKTDMQKGYNGPPLSLNTGNPQDQTTTEPSSIHGGQSGAAPENLAKPATPPPPPPPKKE